MKPQQRWLLRYNHLQGGQVYGSATTTRGSFPWRRVTVSALIGWTSKFLPVRCWMKTLSVRESDDNVRVRYKSNSSPLSGQRQPPCLSGQALLQHSVAQQGGGRCPAEGHGLSFDWLLVRISLQSEFGSTAVSLIIVGRQIVQAIWSLISCMMIAFVKVKKGFNRLVNSFCRYLSSSWYSSSNVLQRSNSKDELVWGRRCGGGTNWGWEVEEDGGENWGGSIDQHHHHY